MSNIAIYTTKNESTLMEMLQGIEDINVRIEAADTLKDYEGVVPSLIIIEDVPNLKDELMVFLAIWMDLEIQSSCIVCRPCIYRRYS